MMLLYVSVSPIKMNQTSNLNRLVKWT